MMDVVGYAIIKDAADGVSPIPLKNFYKERVRVIDFATDGGVLVIDNDAKGVAQFDKEAVQSSFRCECFNEVICPPNLGFMEKMEYYGRCMMRKGGYNGILREMVIMASLHKRDFNDGFLWEKQQEG